MEQQILITGAGGTLGSVALTWAQQRGIRCWGTIRTEADRARLPAGTDLVVADLRDPGALLAQVQQRRPRAVIHLAAMSQVAQVRASPIEAHEVNVDATAELAAAAAEVGARFVFASTDMVFDGTSAPYTEEASPAPLSEYGRSKLRAESHVLRYPTAVVARLPLLFGVAPAARKPAFFEQLARRLLSPGHGARARLFSDEFRTPLLYEDAAAALVRLAQPDGPSGVVHVPGPERLSRAAMGLALAQALQIAPEFDVIQSATAVGAAEEPRPADLSLSGERFRSAFGCEPGRPTSEAFAHMATLLQV